jgi:hypothetical protein
MSEQARMREPDFAALLIEHQALIHSLASLTGDLDDIDDGTTYARVKATELTDGEVNDSAIDHNQTTNTHNLTTDIDHDQLTNFASDEHFTEASIDHTNILNIGSNTHPQLDSHLADNSQAHTDYLINTGNDTTSGKLTAIGGFTIGSHDLTDSGTGKVLLKTTDATDTNTILEIKGNGNGVGRIDFFDQDDAEFMNLFCISGVGFLTGGGVAWNGFSIQGNGLADVFLFQSTWEENPGGTPKLIIYGDDPMVEETPEYVEIYNDPTSGHGMIGTRAQSLELNPGDGNTIISEFIVFNKASGKGIKVDSTTPTFGWRDLEGFEIPDPTGGDRPTLSTYNSGGEIKENAFSNGDKLRIRYHIPHDYVKGTDIFSHIHWSHNGTAISGNVVFGITSDYAKGHNQANFGTEKSISIPYNTTNIATTPQRRHRIEEAAMTSDGGSGTLIDRGLLEPDGVILVTFEVTTNPTITGGSPNNVFVHRADLHYQSSNIATKAKVPDFYV